MAFAAVTVIYIYSLIYFVEYSVLKNPLEDQMLKNGTEFTVLPTDDHWFGVTYKEDKPAVMVSIRRLIESGEYQVDLHSDLLRIKNR